MSILDAKSAGILLVCLIFLHFTIHSNFFFTHLEHHTLLSTAARADPLRRARRFDHTASANPFAHRPPHTAGKPPAIEVVDQLGSPQLESALPRSVSLDPDTKASQAFASGSASNTDSSNFPPTDAAPGAEAGGRGRTEPPRSPVTRVPDSLEPAAGSGPEGAAHPLWGRLLPPAPASVLVTFASSALSDFLLNWVAHVERVPELKPYVVACMDEALLQLCRDRSIPAFLAQNAGIVADRSFLGAEGQSRQAVGADRYYRTDGAAFKKMGVVKALVLENLLSAGYDVLISDADTVWFADPWPVLGRVGQPPPAGPNRLLARADILVSTDCIDYLADVDASVVGMEHNTGVLLLRASPLTVAFTREWQKRALETTDGHDQTEFNRILKGLYTPGVDGKAFPDLSPMPYPPIVVSGAGASAEEEWTSPGAVLEATQAGQMALTQNQTLRAAVMETFERNKRTGTRTAYWMWHGRIRVGILPMAQFMNGHLYFVRQLQTYSGIQPIVVHLTYQFGDTQDYVYGKRQRLREHGLWAPEEDAYFTEESFLSIVGVEPVYEQIVAPYMAVAGHCTDSDPVKERCWHPRRIPQEQELQQGRVREGRDPRTLNDPAIPHLLVQGWLNGVVRSAILLSQHLGLAMILPRHQCWCERFWWLLEDCRVPAGPQQMPMPYECPMDHVFELAGWFRHEIKFRESSFLQSPRVPAEVRGSKLRLRIDLPPGAPPRIDAAAREVHVAREGTYDEARAAVEAAKAAVGGAVRVLEADASELRDGLRPCLHSDPPALARLNDMFYEVLGGVLVEFCSQERNPFVNEEARKLETGEYKFIEEALNCSYPGRDPVTANPVDWPKLITRENRQAWIGPALTVCE